MGMAILRAGPTADDDMATVSAGGNPARGL